MLSIFLLLFCILSFFNNVELRKNIEQHVDDVVLDDNDQFQPLFLFDTNSIAKRLIKRFESTMFWILNRHAEIFNQWTLSRQRLLTNSLSNVEHCVSFDDDSLSTKIENSDCFLPSNISNSGMFPRNISDFYDLDWQRMSGTDKNNDDDDDQNADDNLPSTTKSKTTINHIQFKQNTTKVDDDAAADDATRDIRNRRITFDKLFTTHGSLRLHLINQPTNDSRFDTITGDGYLSSNRYRTPANRDFLLHGVYLVDSGAAILIAAPKLMNGTATRAYLDVASEQPNDPFSQVNLSFFFFINVSHTRTHLLL
jgi:hypothetical protein